MTDTERLDMLERWLSETRERGLPLLDVHFWAARNQQSVREQLDEMAAEGQTA